MNMSQGSAKIYQFPAGGRSALGGRRYQEAQDTTDLTTDLAASSVIGTDCGEAWYHEAAIRESKPAWER